MMITTEITMIETNKRSVLVLSAGWHAVGCVDVETAMSSLYARDYQAIDIGYDEDGNVLKMNPLRWDQWIDIIPRDGDRVINTPFLRIKVPTVIIARNFSRIVFKKRALTLDAIRDRDNSTCQYTGKKLAKYEGSVDHIVAKSKGGKDSWDNLVYCDKSLNIKKGNKTLKECGFTLLRIPTEPLPQLASATIKSSHRDWDVFLVNQHLPE